MVTYENEIQGSARGSIYYKVLMDGVVGSINYTIDVNRAHSAVLRSLGVVHWGSRSAWSDDGVVLLQSTWDMPQVVSWDGAAEMKYDDGRYELTASEASNKVDFRAMGDYGGTLSKW